MHLAHPRWEQSGGGIVTVLRRNPLCYRLQVPSPKILTHTTKINTDLKTVLGNPSLQTVLEPEEKGQRLQTRGQDTPSS